MVGSGLVSSTAPVSFPLAPVRQKCLLVNSMRGIALFIPSLLVVAGSVFFSASGADDGDVAVMLYMETLGGRRRPALAVHRLGP